MIFAVAEMNVQGIFCRNPEEHSSKKHKKLTLLPIIIIHILFSISSSSISIIRLKIKLKGLSMFLMNIGKISLEVLCLLFLFLQSLADS